MGIILGLSAALFWGSADFLARFSSHKIGAYRTLFYMQFLGFAGLGTYLIINQQLQHLIQTVSVEVWLWGLLAAGCNTFASLTFYRALETGKLSLVSPVAASYSAITAVLAFLSGESLGSVRLLGVGLALIGVIMAASSPAEAGEQTTSKGLNQGIIWAICAAFGFGVTFWLLGFQVTPYLGGTTPVWLMRTFTIVFLFTLAFARKQELGPPRDRLTIWQVVGVGIFDTTAYVANGFGVLSDQVAVVTVLSSLFSAVTVLLAWIWLREKLSRFQWLGVCLILVSVILVQY
ncbi:MAG TPA: DMT family transporter [Chloroflexia bacterium]|nr:DMT family transporter [Chloroflexia bacterium]